MRSLFKYLIGITARKYVAGCMKMSVAADDASVTKTIFRNFIVSKSIKHGENASVQFLILSIRSKGNSNGGAKKKR
jgi:hypothetical protein